MKRPALIGLLAALGLALTGCAGGGGMHSPTTSASVTRPTAHSPLVVGIGQHAVAGIDLRNGARILSPTRLAIVTAGSSGCPAVPKTLTVQSADTIRIDLVIDRPSSGICPANYTTTPVVIAIDPEQIDVHHRLTIQIYYPRTRKPIVRTAPPL
jgi:hypothetical protein